ncbi:prolyl oligopeptidase family serine peptidase [Arcobacter sp. YIC-464]|uniref:S9 family peptidase n=1 Tax=Arcobacter sp. YIC-464 TaxID=3376631 RepID=UPI003C1B839F
MYNKCIIIFLLSIFAYSNEINHDKSLVSSEEELQKIASFETRNFEYDLKDFFSNPKKSDLRLSPNGKYLSYFIMKDGHKYLEILNIDKNQRQTLLAEDTKRLIASYLWANDSSIIFASDINGNENYQIFSVNINTKKQKALTPFENVKVSLLDPLEKDKNHIIILMNKNNKQIAEPYKININTGEYELLYSNEDMKNPIVSYYFDKNGVLIAFVKLVNGIDNVLYYKENKKKEFKKISNTNWKNSFNFIILDYSTPYPDDAYILVRNEKYNTSTLILYDLKNENLIREVFRNEKYDLEGVTGSKLRNYEIDYFTYYSDKYTIQPISSVYKELHKKFQKQFSTYQFRVEDISEDEKRYLLFVNSDRLVGAYFLYDLEKNAFRKLAHLKLFLEEDKMAKTISFEFKARDGLEIQAYLTLPNDIKKPALIVNPHGGPYGVRDIWTFNSEVQLFASRGYATLQVNYRGSGGFGRAFEIAGHKQIGRAMLNDLEDAVSHVKKLNLIDDKNIAIYGASYGGLATLGSLIKTPDLYKCGVDYVGVSNLLTFFNSFPPYWEPYKKQVFQEWYNPNDKEELKIIKEVSPALNAEKITKNVLVVQGAHDPRVNINESDQIVKALRAKGLEVPYLVKYDEGHGFARVGNQIELYNVMLGFFAKCFEVSN